MPSSSAVHSRSRSRQPTRRRTGNRSGRAASPVRRTLFHAPSFSAGVVMGAVVVLGAAYLPEILSSSGASGPAPAATAGAQQPQLTFEFDDLLRNSRVTANPEPYKSEPMDPEGPPSEQIVLQAASFRSRDDAERLRAALLLMDLPAATRQITLDNGAWYRVTVGPFDSQVKAQRALTRLRENDIAALWTERPVP